MFWLVCVLTQYVALCGAATVAPPNANNLWQGGFDQLAGGGFNQGGQDPFFGNSWWGNQLNFDSFFHPTDPPIYNEVLTSSPNTAPTIQPSTTPPAPTEPTTRLTYDTATPSGMLPTEPPSVLVPTEPPTVLVPTDPPTIPPTVPNVNKRTESSISLQELIRLAASNSNGGSNSAASQLFLQMMGSAANINTAVNSMPTITVNKNKATPTEAAKLIPTQTIVTTVAPMETSNVTETAAVTTPTATTPANTPAPTTKAPTTTTTKATTTTAPPPTTTTTTTPRPTTTRVTTTTTAPQLPTVPTVKPLVKMTLGEILALTKLNIGSNKKQQQPSTTTTLRPPGCHYKGQFYKPLAEIERGQTGNWCYGSYCNHEGTVIHWDDHQCTVIPTTPPTTTPAEPAMDVSAVAGALTPSEIDALATVPGMSGIADTLRQYGLQSNTVSPPSPPTTTVQSVGMSSMFGASGMGAGMSGMAGMAGGMGIGGGMGAMGGGGMPEPSIIELARLAGIDLPSMPSGGSSGSGSMGEMSGMSGMGGMGGMSGLGGGGGSMAELAAMAGIELPSGLSGSGGAGLGGMSGMSGMGGGSGNMAELAAMAGLEGMSGMSGSSGMSAMGGMGSMSGMGSGMGCYVNGRHYPPGADIENHRDYGRCYGSYCDFNSKVVNWNDRCRAAMSPIAQPQQQISMRQLQQLDLL